MIKIKSFSKTPKMTMDSNRWLFVALGFVIYLCMGSVYAWSIFRRPIESLLRIGATESGIPYMVFLVCFALVMPFAGSLLDNFGPRKVIILGGAFVGAGWILSSYATNLLSLTISYGVIAGSGVGLVYGAPIMVATKWFPEKKGFAVGLTLAGFGMSPFVTAPLSNALIGQYGVMLTFRILGLAFLAVIILLALPIKLPAPTWKPEGWCPTRSKESTVNWTTAEMLKSKVFYSLWVCFVIGTMGGLMAIGISSPVAEEVININPQTAALAVSMFAIFNGISRPFFGWLTDRFTPKATSLVAFAMVATASIGMLFATEGHTLLYLISFTGFWMTLGGWLAIAPAATATFFGSKHYAKNYGVIYTAYGVGAVLGTFLSGRLRDLLGSYLYAFYPTALLALLGMAITIALIRAPQQIAKTTQPQPYTYPLMAERD